jgi:hypothetical protein
MRDKLDLEALNRKKLKTFDNLSKSMIAYHAPS